MSAPAIAALLSFACAACAVGAAHATPNVRAVYQAKGQAPSDFFGSAVADAGDVNGDGYRDVIVGARGNDAGGSDAGRAYIYFGGPFADDVADVIMTAGAGQSFGSSVAGAGDVNGDGFDDVIVGAPFCDIGGTDRGCAFVYFGGAPMDAVADIVLLGQANNDQHGTAVSGAGDLNGDGYDDVVSGAPFHDAGGSNAGRAYVFLGGPTPDSIADLFIDGLAPSDFLGAALAAAGDVNGDGYDDLLVGAYGVDDAGATAGAAYVFHGGAVLNAVADATFLGEAAGDQFGRFVAGAGDVNDDGYDDLFVGAYLNDAGGVSAGRAYLFHGGSGIDSIADLVLTGEAAGDQFGGAVDGGSDVNGDGHADLLVGAFGNDFVASSAGRAYVFFGGPVADTTADLLFNGEFATDAFGVAVAMLGDANRDGFADVAIGANLNDQAGTNAGKVYVYDAFRYHLLAPNGGETWPVGSRQAIEWLGRDPADVWLSADGGATFSRIESRVGGGARNGITVLVPHLPTTFASVRVTPSGPSVRGRAQSDSLFTISIAIALLSFTAEPSDAGGVDLRWATEPAVGPAGIAGYRITRERDGVAMPVGPAVITGTSFHDAEGLGARHRLYAVNGLGDASEVGAVSSTEAIRHPLLELWPAPYAGGTLEMRLRFVGRVPSGHSPQIELFDVLGRSVRTLTTSRLADASFAATWDGRDSVGRPIRNGLYFAQARFGAETIRRKVVVAR